MIYKRNLKDSHCIAFKFLYTHREATQSLVRYTRGVLNVHIAVGEKK